MKFTYLALVALGLVATSNSTITLDMTEAEFDKVITTLRSALRPQVPPTPEGTMPNPVGTIPTPEGIIPVPTKIPQNFDFTGEWTTDVDYENCIPNGFLTITQDANGKVTANGVWKDNKACREVGLAGQKLFSDKGVVEGNTLKLAFPAPEGANMNRITMYKNPKNEDVRINYDKEIRDDGAHLDTKTAGRAYKVNGVSSFKHLLGQWKVNRPETDLYAEEELKRTGRPIPKCCFPETMEVTSNPSAYGIFHVQSKYSESDDCKAEKLNGVTISSDSLSQSPQRITFIKTRNPENHLPEYDFVIFETKEAGTFKLYDILPNGRRCYAYIQHV